MRDYMKGDELVSQYILRLALFQSKATHFHEGERRFCQRKICP